MNEEFEKSSQQNGEGQNQLQNGMGQVGFQNDTATISMNQSVGVATPYVMNMTKPETEHSKKLRENFGFFAPVTFLYAAFYAFCMYKNASGITYPFFMAGSLIYMCVCLGKLTITLKKGSIFYMISIMLLAISTFCTDSEVMINLNKTGIFLLIMSFILRQYYDTSKWKIGKFFAGIGETMVVSLGELPDPFVHAAGYFKAKKSKNMEKTALVIVGILIAIPLVAIVLLLLGSADAVFRDVLNSMVVDVDMSDGVAIFFLILFIFFESYIITAHLCKHPFSDEVKDKKKWTPIIGIVVNGILSLVYMLFCSIQVLFLFGGTMELPAGYTYAEYAREGFFELLTVGILNFIIVLVTMSLFKNNKLLKAILTIMCLCTFIMIASSALRMIMYIRYYYMTFTRVLVLWTLLVLFLLFVGVIMSVYIEKFNLFHYCTVIVTVFYIALSFARPDYLIAKINITALNQNETQTEGFFLGDSQVDMNYLIRLSADAAPVIAPVIAEEYGADSKLAKQWKRKLAHMDRGYDLYRSDREKFNVNEPIARLKADDFRTFNLSRNAADKALTQYGFQ